MENKLEKEVRFLKAYIIIGSLLGAVFILTAFTLKSDERKFEEITAKRIKIVDSTEKTRVILAGEFPKPRANLAGLIFNNEDGYEAGGLVYSGTRNKDGKIEAGSILTFDQYRNDQIVALGYDQTGDRKRNGLMINDRPDTQSELVKEMFRAMAAANSVDEAESIRRSYMSRIPGRDVVARRLFAGRDVEGASIVTLSDADGKPRLQLRVDRLGKASITFLDSTGRVVRIIKP